MSCMYTIYFDLSVNHSIAANYRSWPVHGLRCVLSGYTKMCYSTLSRSMNNTLNPVYH